MSEPKKKPFIDKHTMIFFGGLLALILGTMIFYTPQSHSDGSYVSYDSFVSIVLSDQVLQVVIDEERITGVTIDGKPFKTVAPPSDPMLMDDLYNHNVETHVMPKREDSYLLTILPTLLLIGVIVWMVRRTGKTMKAAGKGGFGAGDDKAKLIEPEKVKLRFSDVAGIPEAKAELEEVVEFLKNPEKFTRVGGKIPSGVLLEGDPGNGKTYLAKATAGEAGVPFFTMAGSDFVEKFVGVGASRVRALFEKAKKAAPCIVFIDEFDAVGKQRGGGVSSNDERDSTVNALLVEMDGFNGSEGVIIIAATNMADKLDKALTRPGRFDRHVNVPYPDISGRKAILKVHAKNVEIDTTLDLDSVAAGCVGMSGADLANLINEAALLAGRGGEDCIVMEHIEKAKDKILMGVERKTMVLTDDEKKCTAYHEAGHAIVGMTVPEHDAVHKVSIVPRGRALGVTMYQPEQDRVSYSERRLDSQLLSLMGGRAAEELIFGEKAVTTGASNDIERTTGLARQMVEKWGMSELGVGYFAKDQNSYSDDRSPELVAKVEEQIRKKVDAAYNGAKDILNKKMHILHAMSEELIDVETIDAEAVKRLMDMEDNG